MTNYSLQPRFAIQEQQLGLSAFQQIEIYHERDYSRIEAAIEFPANRTMRMFLLSELGQNLGLIEAVGSEWRIDRERFLLEAVPVNDLATAVQYIFWPNIVLEQFFLGTQWSIVALDNRRELYRDKTLMAYIEYDSDCPWNGNTRYVDISSEYTVEIKSTLLNSGKHSRDYGAYCPF